MCPTTDNRAKLSLSVLRVYSSPSSAAPTSIISSSTPSAVCSFLLCRPPGETGSAASSAPDKERQPDPRMSAWLAAKEGNREMLRAELEGGADIEHRDPMGRTALMEAAK